MPAKIFISYSTIDLDAVSRAKRVLEAAGHTAYVAQYDAHGGVRLTDDIKKNIESSDVFVVFWSSGAKSSDWVAQEVGLAEAQRKVIVPIVLDGKIKPGGFIGDRKYVSAAEGLEKALSELKAIVDVEAKKKEQATAFLVVGLVLAALLAK